MERFNISQDGNGWSASYYPYPKKGYHGSYSVTEREAILSLRKLMNIEGQFRLPERFS